MQDSSCDTPPVFYDKYDETILRQRYHKFKESYIMDAELIQNGLPIRHQNTPEDITENIVKFVIRNYLHDPSCVWCKGVDKQYGLVGDLYSSQYPDKRAQIEVKSFTSIGPSQFGPDKKFSVLYFLDLKEWLHDRIVVWRVNLDYTTDIFKNIKVSKKQTIGEQFVEGRRPHISWKKIYSQISDYCEKVYDGTFDDIFIATAP